MELRGGSKGNWAFREAGPSGDRTIMRLRCQAVWQRGRVGNCKGGTLGRILQLEVGNGRIEGPSVGKKMD